MLDHLNFKEKRATLQENFEYFEKIARFLYANLCPTNLKSRKSSHLALNSDTEVLTLMLYQNAIGVKSQRKFYRVFRTSFQEKTLGVLVNSYRCLL